ncbi:hypothetical protein B0H16DRAFT_1498964 [Mycena metata]|uniref:Sodium/calcium exchanger membrane region domain-containing protein n=1 Tax=Mycena metata TaxID=1033252 RepID=A0AAD7KAN4_9AGAR|nr:hypothetical protein B0H16DRAFT_1498964 [Mycena metata]
MSYNTESDSMDSNIQHQRAFDMLSGQIMDYGLNDDEEQIRRPPEGRLYDDKRGTVATNWSDGASAYPDSGVAYLAYRHSGMAVKEQEEEGYKYPNSVIDMPYYPDPYIDPQDDPSRASSYLSPGGSFWERFRGKGRPYVGWTQSLAAIVRSSWINVLLVFIPVAWVLHFAGAMSHTVQFAFCSIAIIPLNRLLDYGGENLALYCGKDIGDLVVITLNNTIEAILAICLLARCQLRLLQSTVVGVVLLRLLLFPACAFIADGAAQELHPHLAGLNQTLLTTEVLTILLPAAFFAALNSSNSAGTGLSDDVRGDILKVSRGLALILLVVYICSRVFLHNPPGPESQLHEHKEAPAEDQSINPWVGLILLLLTVALLTVTTEFLVESIEPMRERHQIKEEWFGLVLLPFVSFSSECIMSLVYYVHVHLKHYLGTTTAFSAPKTLAEARSIDSSIQFLTFWMPLLVLFAWATHKPLSLLFDVFEVVLLISATFLINYVAAGAKTNWVEGVMLFALYLMIALTAWFYPGQSAVGTMLSCASIQEVLSAQRVPPNSSFTNISFAGFHATLDNNQITNFTDRLRDLKKLYDILSEIERS